MRLPASMRCVRVAVTWNHIYEGKRKRNDACPIALALRDSGHRAEIYKLTATIDGQPVVLPHDAVDFIRKFDAGVYVEPVSIALWCKPQH